jgi:hypothetical protein
MRVRDKRWATRGTAAALLATAVFGELPLTTSGDAHALSAAASSTVSAATHTNCAATTRRIVRRFTHAVTDGNADRANKTFASEPAFEWYSTTAPGARLNAVARDRTTLLGYFRDRIARHERLRLTRLTARYERRRNITNFHGTLARSADDLATATHRFKGAATCRGRTRMIVWSMASGGENH